MTSNIDDKLMIVTDQEKIQASDIEGTFYTAGSLGGGVLSTFLTVQTAATSPPTPTVTSASFNVTLQTQPPVRTVPQILWSVFVDNDGDTSWLWPNGANLTTSVGVATRPSVEWGMSEQDSDPNSGLYVWDFCIKNNSTVTQTYYVKIRTLIPAGRGV